MTSGRELREIAERLQRQIAAEYESLGLTGYKARQLTEDLRRQLAGRPTAADINYEVKSK